MTKIKCICANCGKEYFVQPYRIREGSKYCSRKCFNEALKKEKEKIETKICKYCGKEFEIKAALKWQRKKIFCSLECSRKASKGRIIKGKIQRICKYCGKEFEVYPSQIKQGEGIYCSKGCQTLDKKGKPNIALRKENKIIKCKDYAYIEIEKKNKLYKVLIDTADIEKVKLYYWYIEMSHKNKRYNVVTNGRLVNGVRQRYTLSRFIMGYNGKLQIDHINRNTLDNRKCNLRVVSPFENSQNKECPNGYSGVFFDKNGNKWRAVIRKNNITQYLGSYKTKEEAINARKNKEKELGYISAIYKN